MSLLLRDCVSSGLCGCGRAGTRKLGSRSVELSASNQISSSLICISEVFWSFHQWQRCTDVAQILNASAFPRKTRPKEETSRGRKTKLLSEGN